MERFIENEYFNLEIKNPEKCDSLLIGLKNGKESQSGVVGNVPDLLMNLESVTSAVIEALVQEGDVSDDKILCLLSFVHVRALERVRQKENEKVTDQTRIF